MTSPRFVVLGNIRQVVKDAFDQRVVYVVGLGFLVSVVEIFVFFFCVFAAAPPKQPLLLRFRRFGFHPILVDFREKPPGLFQFEGKPISVDLKVNRVRAFRYDDICNPP